MDEAATQRPAYPRRLAVVRGGALLRSFCKFLAVVIASLAAAAVLGIGASKLSDIGETEADFPLAPAPAPRSTAASPTPGTRVPRATNCPGTNSGDVAKPKAPGIRVLSSTILTAATASGRQRRRARLTVRLRVTAHCDRATLGTARLIKDDDEVQPDPDASYLLDPIAGGRSATATLRFETAGALTDRLVKERRATLRVNDHALALRLTTP